VPERRYRVQWSQVAVRDLEEIVAFIAADAPKAAARVLTDLESRATTLGRHPDRGRLVPELLHFGFRGWRELVVAPYRIVYRIAGREVIVLAVFDGRRELSDVLLERLVRD